MEDRRHQAQFGGCQWRRTELGRFDPGWFVRRNVEPPKRTDAPTAIAMINVDRIAVLTGAHANLTPDEANLALVNMDNGDILPLR